MKTNTTTATTQPLLAGWAQAVAAMVWQAANFTVGGVSDRAVRRQFATGQAGSSPIRYGLMGAGSKSGWRGLRMWAGGKRSSNQWGSRVSPRG